MQAGVVEEPEGLIARSWVARRGGGLDQYLFPAPNSLGRTAARFCARSPKGAKGASLGAVWLRIVRPRSGCLGRPKGDIYTLGSLDGVFRVNF